MVSGTQTEDIDVELLVAARSGELEAIASVCNHYRGRLLTLAGNVGAPQPEEVVQDALTEALLAITPVDEPSMADFEQGLFDRVIAGSDARTTAEIVLDPGVEAGFEAAVTTSEHAFRAPELAAELGMASPTVAGGVHLNPESGPVDWSALAVDDAVVEPTLVANSNRILAGGAAVVCGLGVLAAIAFFLGAGGSSDGADEPQLAALVPDEGATPDEGPGSEPAAPASADQNRSSGTVTDGPVPTTTIGETDTSAAPSTTATTITVTTGEPATTASTAPSTSTTTGPPTTARRPGDFSNQSIDNESFGRGNYRDHDFTGATLNDVVFTRADLRGVSFAGATLLNVRFTNVDLTGADFRGAVLDDTNLEDVNISGVDFTGSRMDNGQLEGYWRGRNRPIGWPTGDFEFDD